MRKPACFERRPSHCLCKSLGRGLLDPEKILGFENRGDGVRPTCIESYMGNELYKFVLRHAVFYRTGKVESHLLRFPEGYQRGACNHAAVAFGELGTLPYVLEQCLIGELRQLGCEIAEKAGCALVGCACLRH